MVQETDKLYRKKLKAFDYYYDFYDHFIARTGGSRFVDILDQSAFFLPLTDNTQGAVDLVLSRGTGVATFTRATTAWTKLPSGLWKSVASGVARSSYLGANTAVGAYGGYLAENAGTQLVTPTASIRDMTNAAWAVVTMTTAKTATGIDGVVNSASTITATGANSTILQTLVAAASSRTYSAFVRRKTGTGTCLLKSGAATLDITALINTTTYTRVSLTDSTLNTSFGIQINTSGDALEVDFNQFESGAFATSPMDAQGAVRNTDALTYSYAGNALNTIGTVYAEVSAVGGIIAGTSQVVQLTDGTGQILSFDSATNVMMFDGTNNPIKSGLSSTLTASRKRAGSWGSGLSVTGDGLSPATSAFDGTMGAGGGNIFIVPVFTSYLTVKNVRIWTTQLPDATLSNITQ